MHARNWLYLLLIAAPAAALGQGGIWRCGNSYQQAPCPGGRIVEAPAAPAAGDAARAAAHAARDAQRASELEQARRAREAQAPGAVIPAAQAAPALPTAARPERKAKRQRGTTKPDALTAVRP